MHAACCHDNGRTVKGLLRSELGRDRARQAKANVGIGQRFNNDTYAGPHPLSAVTAFINRSSTVTTRPSPEID